MGDVCQCKIWIHHYCLPCRIDIQPRSSSTAAGWAVLIDRVVGADGCVGRVRGFPLLREEHLPVDKAQVEFFEPCEPAGDVLWTVRVDLLLKEVRRDTAQRLGCLDTVGESPSSLHQGIFRR